MEVITVTSASEVQQLYKDNNVNPNRQKSVNDKFVVIPDQFTCYGLVFIDLKIGDNEMKNVPAIAISEDGTKYITVGTFRQAYTDKTTASKITKKGDNENHFLVVNNKAVHRFSEGLSEAEVVAFVQGKTFKAAAAKDYPTFQPKYDTTTRKPVYPTTEAEALKMVLPKSYRALTVKE